MSAGLMPRTRQPQHPESAQCPKMFFGLPALGEAAGRGEPLRRVLEVPMISSVSSIVRRRFSS